MKELQKTISLVFATPSAREWVEESNEHTNVVLKAQSLFRPEGATSLCFTEFDESVMRSQPCTDD